MPQSPWIPDGMPVLSRGKHRSPRKGACFMELASYLAGEKWSDSPSCTHPLLGEVARNVNVRTSDAARPLLATLIPSVVGLATDDPRADARIALRCALRALPVVGFHRQRSLAVGVLTCELQLAALDDPGLGALHVTVRTALAEVPQADAWASRFAARSGLDRKPASRRHFSRYGAPGIVNIAASGIADAAAAAVDERLRAMLEVAIEEGRALAGVGEHAPIEDALLLEAWALTR